MLMLAGIDNFVKYNNIIHIIHRKYAPPSLQLQLSMCLDILLCMITRQQLTQQSAWRLQHPRSGGITQIMERGFVHAS